MLVDSGEPHRYGAEAVARTTPPHDRGRDRVRIPRPRSGQHDAGPAEPRGSTGSPARAGSGGTIRSRIVRTLALPVAAVLVLLGVITVIEVDDYRTADASANAVTLVLAVQDLVQELQTERGLTAGLLGGNAGFRAELAPARKRVDDQRARVEQLIADGGTVQDRVATAVRQLDGLAGVRAGTDTGRRRPRTARSRSTPGASPH